MATVVPAVTSSSVTVPACGAEMTCSIFIASTTSRLCPAATSSPTATFTTVTVPGIGAARVSAPERAAPVSDASTGSWSRTCQVSPSRPNQRPSGDAAWANAWVTQASSRVTRRSSAVMILAVSALPGSGPSGPQLPESGAGGRPPSPMWPKVSSVAAPHGRRPTCTGSWPGMWKCRSVRAGVPPRRQPSPAENGSVQVRGPGAGAGECCRSSAAAAYTSSGTPSGTSVSTSRSTRPVSRSPATTAGWPRSRRRKPALVGTPRTTVSASAARRRRRAVARSGPYAITFDSIGSYRLPTSPPSPSPESVRTPPPCGSCSASTAPPEGRKPRAGSSAQTRASTACPVRVMSCWA